MNRGFSFVNDVDWNMSTTVIFCFELFIRDADNIPFLSQSVHCNS